MGRRIDQELYAKADVPMNLTPDRPLVECVEKLEEILAKDLMQPGKPITKEEERPQKE